MQNLPFQPLCLEKQKDYRERFDLCSQVASDYSFLNLWAWGEDYGLGWAWDDRCVWIRQTRPEELLWAPVGPWNDVDWSRCFNPDASIRTTFIRVPEKLLEIWQANLGDRVTFEEERGHWDYIYTVNDLIELGGNRYHKKKNLLHQFIKKYDSNYRDFGPELIEMAMAMQTDWCTWRDCESSDILSAENHAIYRTLTDWNELQGLFGGAVMVNGIMVAYTVAEQLTENTVLIHFEKGNTDFKGVYQAINQQFLAHSANHFTYVNREQDLNDAGLRKSKLSYLPVDYVRKYRVRLPGFFCM
jgi:uncharacterized protein